MNEKVSIKFELTKTFFVTGASGFIGKNVCKLLVESGAEVRALIRSQDEELIELGVKIFIGDLFDEKVLANALLDSEVVIHCAGDARFGNGAHYYEANVELTRHVIKFTKMYASKECRFVYVSTIGAIDRFKDDRCISKLNEDSSAFPTSDYGKSKQQAEEVVKDSGLLYSIVRPTMVVGKDMRYDSHFSVFARQALAGHLVGRFQWPGIFSVVHVEDLAWAILSISTHNDAVCQTFFCAGEEISIADFFHQCSPDKKRVSLLPIARMAVPLVRWLPFSLKAMLLPALTASDMKLRGLGWSPTHSAESSLQEIIDREKSRLDPDVSPGGQTVITGAASGLGRALAIYFLRRREHLLLIDKDATGLAELFRTYNNCVTKVVDLSNEEEVSLLYKSPEWRAFNVTEIYACAGIGLRGRMHDIPMDMHRKMFSINVLARISMAKSVINQMRKRHFGRIVFISSSSAFQPLPYMATYAATNSALLSIGEAWSAEANKYNVQIMTVCPGGMKTNFQKSGGVKEIDGETLMTPEKVANEIIKGLHNNKATLIVSFRSLAMSMFARLIPRSLNVKLWFRLMENMR